MWSTNPYHRGSWKGLCPQLHSVQDPSHEHRQGGVILGGNDQDKDKSSEPKEKSSAGDAFNFMGLANTLSKMEREEDNPEAAMFAAHFGKLFKSYLKD